MKVLLVDLGSSYVEELRHLLSDYTVTVVEPGCDYASPSGWADAIVLSGGHGYPATDAHHYRHELSLVREYNKKLIGICLGHELVACAYGGQLKRYASKVHGYRPIRLSRNFARMPDATVDVFENHRWSVSSLSPSLQALATSTAGVEVLRHVYRPHYGLQFHPEITAGSLAGRAIFNQLLLGPAIF